MDHRGRAGQVRENEEESSRKEDKTRLQEKGEVDNWCNVNVMTTSTSMN